MPIAASSSVVAFYHPQVEGSLRLADTTWGNGKLLDDVKVGGPVREAGVSGSSYLTWTCENSLICGSEGTAFEVAHEALGEVQSRAIKAFSDTSDIWTLPDGRLLSSSRSSGVRIFPPFPSWGSSASTSPQSTLSIHAASAVCGTSDGGNILWGTESGCVQLVKIEELDGPRFEWKIDGVNVGVASLRCTEIGGGSSFAVMAEDCSVLVGDVHACGIWSYKIPSESEERIDRLSSDLVAPSPCNESLLVAAIGPSRAIRFADVRQKKALKDLRLKLAPSSVSLRADGAFMAVGSEESAIVYDLRSLRKPVVVYENTPARSVAFYREHHYEKEEPPSPKSTPRGKQSSNVRSMTPHTQRLAGMLRRIGGGLNKTTSDDVTAVSSRLGIVSRIDDEEGSRSIMGENEEDGESHFEERRGSQASAGGVSLRKLSLNGNGSDADMEGLISTLNRMHVETIGKLSYLEMRQRKMEETLERIVNMLSLQHEKK
ncbi:hypothetical protein FOL47_005985 [Perkinsus chesapeaki]|uniref:Uncharacterized protein n=1 Tax=Perkinsus chesapeaki TaxID=330153 RepID=A0A7J6LUQ5_PERCH|nr:hypothetical protein FOL47_005985 [Perkinsus chesapeaki]